MGFRIVTINREFGSGGRTIGKQVAQRMGVTCYDEELVTQIAKESGMSQTFIQNFSEEASATSSLLFTLNNWANSALSDQIYIIQRNIIQELAEQGPCVIVGRCADYFLKDRTDCLNVFIHADMELKRTASSGSTAKRRTPRKSASWTRISAASPITSTTPIRPGAWLPTIISLWTAVCWA